MGTLIRIIIILLFISNLCFAGVSFDGSDDYISLGNDSSLQPANFSISLWTKKTADKDPAKMTLLEVPYNNEGGAPFASYAIIYDRNNANELELFLGFTDDSFAAHTTSDGSLTAGQWHHVVCVFDDDGDNLKIYRDNVAKYDDTVSKSVKYFGTDNLYVGIDKPTAEPYYGEISELAVWNTVLSATDVEILYKSKVKGMPLQIKPANLAGYWPLNDIGDGANLNGASFVDRSGNGNTGTGSDSGSSGGQGRAESLLSYP